MTAIQNETRAMLLQEKVKEFVTEGHPKRGRGDAKLKLSNFDNLSQDERAKQNSVSRYTQMKLDYLADHRQDLEKVCRLPL